MISQWYVKDLSKLTGVSVQTLHHYDRIGLLNPSRLANGYRLYSEKDLLKLQQIIALKFFCFELSQIKTLLAGNVDMNEHFSVQVQFLEEKAKSLLEASKSLKNIVSECNDNKPIPWKTIIKLIEVYRMTQRLEKTWAGKVLTPKELKQYANFQTELKTRFTESEHKTFENDWGNLIAQVNVNLDKDPKSEIGVSIAKRCMDMTNNLYGAEHANLKHSIWENGFKKGKMNGENFLDPKIIDWLGKAIDAYYHGRIYSVLDQATANVVPELSYQWNELMDEMFGNSQSLKQEVIDIAMTDSRISIVARKWLQQFAK